ncbi:hypothetical protein [Sporosarcina sp. ITBMC105]
MTLILSLNFGGFLTVMSSDTRKVFSMNVGGETIDYKYSGKKSKIERLSPYCIYGGGGSDSLVDAIKTDLKNSGAVYIEELVQPLEEIIARMRKNPLTRWKMNEDGEAQIMITGFNADNSSCKITFVTGVDTEVTYDVFSQPGSLFGIFPSEDEFIAAVESTDFVEPQDNSGYVDASVTYLAGVQRAFSVVNPDAVSETFEYIAIRRDPHTGEFTCYQDSINLNESS